MIGFAFGEITDFVNSGTVISVTVISFIEQRRLTYEVNLKDKILQLFREII